MQTILGSGGAIGTELAKALKEYTEDIRLVSRHPQKVNETDELLSADLFHEEQVRNAVRGSSIVYLTVGFPYDYKYWKENWPKLMQYVISACKEHQTKLVFFDNINMYDSNYLNGMDENTPINPPSKKGEIRAQLVDMIFNEVNKGDLTALIARSADFYGPGAQANSVLSQTVIQPLSQGKRATWLGSVDVKHSYTYTPDAGKATALLGNTEDAFNQTWHLPTTANPPTGKKWIEMFAKELRVPPKYMAVSKFVVRLMGLFQPIMREMVEMMYQYDRDYVFDSSKFEQHFDFKPTPYLDAIRQIVEFDYKNESRTTEAMKKNDA
ncbi:MAG TPA: NAD-dependent epimerase/dehydratase family protein [Balneolales bacterium]|nr:NAD-dependent epimerase/dehydratase family protein [Balneolales bacterium]